MEGAQAMTLEQRLDLIAQHVPAFRLKCPCKELPGEGACYPVELCATCVLNKASACLRCHGHGYFAKPASALAETLHSLGWVVHIRYCYPLAGGITAEVWLREPKRHGLAKLATSADEALVTATLVALGVTVL